MITTNRQTAFEVLCKHLIKQKCHCPIMAQRKHKKSKGPVRIWETGHKCEVYDLETKKWVKGEVIEVFKDEEGEWVNVKYGRNTKQVPPDSSKIRNLQKNNQTDSIQGWKVGNQCELYSRAKGQWTDGAIINIYSNEMGNWLRVQYGQQIQDVLSKYVTRDLKPRGATSLNVSIEDIQTFKSIAVKHRSTAPFLQRIFANSEQFVSNDTVQSYVVIYMLGHDLTFCFLRQITLHLLYYVLTLMWLNFQSPSLGSISCSVYPPNYSQHFR